MEDFSPEALISWRQKQGKKRSDVADEIGVNPNTIRYWELGKSAPRGKNLAKIMDLMGGSDGPPPPPPTPSGPRPSPAPPPPPPPPPADDDDGWGSSDDGEPLSDSKSEAIDKANAAIIKKSHPAAPPPPDEDEDEDEDSGETKVELASWSAETKTDSPKTSVQVQWNRTQAETAVPPLSVSDYVRIDVALMRFTSEVVREYIREQTDLDHKDIISFAKEIKSALAAKWTV